MNVIFISQCQKKALGRTRMVLDAFANRIGDNTWQTAITEDGLMMVKKLLRQTASKNTAVSCHKIKTRSRTELLWTIGRKNQFNQQGFVPVNTTKRNILHSEWENNWHFLDAMMTVSVIAGLMHDLGKSTQGFQNKLKKSAKIADTFRHEWISLQLFLKLIEDCETDNQVFERFIHIQNHLKSKINLDFKKEILNKAVNLTQIPPIAQWIAWLIMTHHRLPPLSQYYFSDPRTHKNKLATDHSDFKLTLEQYYQQIKPLDYWVKNPNSQYSDDFFQFNQIIWDNPDWQHKLKRYAKKAQNSPFLQNLIQSNQAIDNPFLICLSRLALMVGDHNYSSLTDPKQRQAISGSLKTPSLLIANTNPKTGQANQTLDEHLLGVANLTADFCHKLPILHEKLPKLARHEPLAKNTDNPLFQWQNQAFD